MIVPDLKLLAQQYQKAKIFFHKDLDGVTSAIAMRVYLKKAGITVVDAETIQYGNEEYIIKDSPDDVMNV
ncbi:MAG: hypothetical protein KAS32_31585, partial [Candidatus Peribacteraceae bacterium]|nr:hypothetical protein [Candidatus Peribacteraceae bacterium]